jgi:hypothetical protein
MTALDIFRPGRHVAMSGEALAFSEADLEATAKAYDPAVHEAPIVVGHPAHNKPAYGWVKGLAFAEGRLAAEPHQVDPDFAELVKAGRFKKISASFYKPDAPANPVPGVYYLRHVGLLGAAPPAVKGLKDAQFADGEEGVVAFGEYATLSILSRLFRRLREAFIEEKGAEAADKLIPSWDVEQLADLAAESAREDLAAGPAAYTEDPMSATPKPEAQTDLQQKMAELEKRQAEFAEREAKLKVQEKALAEKDLAAFVDGLVKAGRVLPVDRDGALAFAASLDAEATLSFGEGDKAKTVTGLAWFKDFLGRVPAQVAFGEKASETTAAPSADFAMPAGYSAPPEQLERAARIEAHAKQHNLTFAEAAKAFPKEA